MFEDSRICSLIRTNFSRYIWPKLLVDSDNARSTKTKVVLEGDARIADLPLVSHATQLPAELGALGEACGSEWVALRDKPAARVDDAATAICEVIAIYCLTCLAFLAQAQRLVCDELVCAKAVMKFNNIDLVWGHRSLFIRLLRRKFRHSTADQVDVGGGKRTGLV